MDKPILLVEDSTAGLYMWTLLNTFVLGDTFDIRISNPQFYGISVSLSSFERVCKLKRLRNVVPSAGYHLFAECVKMSSPGSAIIAVIDFANDAAPAVIAQCKELALEIGVSLEEFNYNCASDIFLSFKDLKLWCLRCSRIPAHKRGNEKYVGLDEILEELQEHLIKNEVGTRLLQTAPKLYDFATEHRIQCFYKRNTCSVPSLEHTLDYFLQVYTENSRLRSTKYCLSDCFCYDCGFLEYFCNRDDFLGKKLRDIYEHSILKPRMERVARKLGIELQFSSPESRPRVVVPKSRGTGLQSKSFVADSIDLGIGLEAGTTPGDTESDTAISEDTVTESEKDESEELTDLFGEEICV